MSTIAQHRQWTWLFDLDNTLHDANPVIFPRIAEAMTAYIETNLQLNTPDAHALRTKYWSLYGATLKGLVLHHGVNPHHFLQETHQFPDLLDILVFESSLRRVFHRLPGQKILFSNAPRHYAQAAVKGLGIKPFFNRILGLEDVGFHAKPGKKGYLQILKEQKLAAHHVIMVEDTLENLWTAHQLGMRTVWITQSKQHPNWLDGKITQLTGLSKLAWVRNSKQGESPC
ncbi:pyrimidine 5'-nucleotidase [Leeia sp. TBRC 13508]|uniref:Pyrimidine 5'-nucleotidase n=1 Tax=Leeia speluncae TaxID=2884804 RepID=A0ABS8D313_9NEIS|nr:pyrimidine 5'-nucleotidase [Leeia speluncae]MCB6182574.1 pyrimidine 5'-nucleotidase [Leeia speluncae]